MINTANIEAWNLIRLFFNDTLKFSYFDFATRMNSKWELCPEYNEIKLQTNNCCDLLNILLTVFRQGLPASEKILSVVIPQNTLSAMREVGLLVKNVFGDLQTPNLILVPFFGKLIISPLPSSYPVGKIGFPDFTLSSNQLALVHMMPLNFNNNKVNILHGAPGLHIIEAALRSAQVTVYEYDKYFSIIKANAVLNDVTIQLLPMGNEYLMSTYDYSYYCNPYSPIPEKLLPYYPTGREFLSFNMHISDWITHNLLGVSINCESILISQIIGEATCIRELVDDSISKNIIKTGRGLHAIVINKTPIRSYLLGYIKKQFCDAGFSDRLLKFDEIAEDWINMLSKQYDDPHIYNIALKISKDISEKFCGFFPIYKISNTDAFVKLSNSWR